MTLLAQSDNVYTRKEASSVNHSSRVQRGPTQEMCFHIASDNSKDDGGRNGGKKKRNHSASPLPEVKVSRRRNPHEYIQTLQRRLPCLDVMSLDSEDAT